MELVSVSLLPDHFIHCCSRVFGKRLDTEGVFLSHQVLDERASHVHTSRDTRSSPELAIDGPSGVRGPLDVGIGGLKRGQEQLVRIRLPLQAGRTHDNRGVESLVSRRGLAIQYASRCQ